MKRFLLCLGGLFCLWLSTGFYLVGSSQRAVVCRFGRSVGDSSQRVILKPNGLHYDWPWPFSRVERLSLNETRTLNWPPRSETVDEAFLSEVTGSPDVFLTGDKNLLHVRYSIHYRISEQDADRYLFQSADLEERLGQVSEQLLVEILATVEVDHIQLQGRETVRLRFLQDLRILVNQQHLGIVIQDVSFDDVSPPIQVKADFLDVANAVADREQFIQNAQSEATQILRAAQADGQSIRDQARSDATERLQKAIGEAGRYRQLVTWWPPSGSRSASKDNAIREAVLVRYYYQTLTDIFQRIKSQVVLDSGQKIDLTIWKALQDPPQKTSSPNQ